MHSVIAMGQAKKVSELTVQYEASITAKGSQPKLADAFEGATTTVYLKGSLSRTETSSALASLTTIYDAKTGTAVLLQEISSQKLLIRMNADNWKEKNKRYDGISFSNTGETKNIAGYNCIKAIATTKDGNSFTVYYTKDIVPENSDYNAEFKGLGGLPMEYEITLKHMTIRYTVSKINLNPVPAARFDIPKTGYREMTYEESRKLGMNG